MVYFIHRQNSVKEVENMNNIITTTERLELRKIHDSDKSFIFELADELHSASFSKENEDFRKKFNQVYWEKITSPDTFNSLMFLKGTDDFIGRICMQHIDEDVPELGINILSRHQNKGFAPESVVAFCNWYSGKYKIKKTKIRIENENAHSIHVVEKLGAEYVSPTPFYDNNILETLRQKFPDTDLSELLQLNVREYVLYLPM